MSEIQKFSDYASKYNVNQDYSALFSGMTANNQNTNSGIDFAEYGSIKSGSYRKLIKAYYAQQDAEKVSQVEDSSKQLTLMKSSADALQKSAEALKSSSLWEKKEITVKDEETGEETTKKDYDWEAITKAVKAFVKDYNDVIEEAGNSDTKNVLRNASWMTQMADKSKSMLARVGISIDKENKLVVDEDKLKSADIGALKTVFTGHNSFANKVAQKAGSISKATQNTSGTYTSKGGYSDTLSKLVSGKVDEEV